MIPGDILKQIPVASKAQRLWLDENYKKVIIPTKLELFGT